MKRKLFVFAIAAMSACAMVSCGSKSGSSENVQKASAEKVESENIPEESDEDVAPKTEEGVIAMLKEAYQDASLIANPEDDMEPNLDLFGMYCTADFNELINQIRAIDAQKEDGSGFFLDDYALWNYWGPGNTVTPKDIDVTIDGDTAEATYQLSNGTEEQTTTVSLAYVDGKWLISDWQQIGMNGVSMVEAMSEYIEENK